MLSAASTESAEMVVDLDSRVGGDNNVFRSRDDSQADGFWEFSPQISIRDPQDELEYDIRYRPSYRAYFTTDNIDGFDHRASAIGTWRMTPASSLSFDGRFARQRRFRFDRAGDPNAPVGSPDASTLQESDDDIIQRSSAAASFNHAFTPRISAFSSYRFGDIDFISSTNIDTRSHTGSIGTNYVFDAKTSVGLSTSARARENDGDDSRGQLSSDTLSADISVSLRRALTKTADLSARVGPSFINSELRPPGGSVLSDGSTKRTESGQSVFAAIDFEQRWRKTEFFASYTRSESGSGGTAAASILDQVDLTLVHRPLRRLHLRLKGQWSNREELSDEVGQDQKVVRYRLAFFVQHQLDRGFSLIGRVSYVNQETDNFNRTVTTNFVQGSVGVRYAFDSIRF